MWLVNISGHGTEPIILTEDGRACLGGGGDDMLSLGETHLGCELWNLPLPPCCGWIVVELSSAFEAPRVLLIRMIDHDGKPVGVVNRAFGCVRLSSKFCLPEWSESV